MPREIDLVLDASTPTVRLAATLAEADGPTDLLCVLLSGSGAQDRDETVAGQRPFRRLREGLARRGVAALSWDDRGVGGSTGDYQAASGQVLVDDALAVIAQLDRLRPSRRVVVVGHSQGCLIGARVAVASPRVHGLVLLAGAARPGPQVLRAQHDRVCRALGFSDAEAADLWALKAAAFAVLGGHDDALDADVGRRLARRLREVVAAHSAPDDLDAVVEDLLEWEWRFLLRHEPAAWLARVRVPTLALAGEHDTQIEPAEDLEATRRALRAPVEVRLLPGLNHLFQVAGSGGVDEYASLGPPFPDDVLDGLRDWLGRRFDV